MKVVVQAPTMTSREIADLVGKDHQQVVLDIFEMLCSLDEDFFQYGEFSEPVGDAPRQLIGCFHLPGALVHVLAGSYGFEAALAIYNEWRDLQAQAYLAAQDPRQLLAGCAQAARDGNAKRRARVQTYIVFNPLTCLIKIGKAINPTARVADIGRMAGCELQTLILIRKDVENDLHRRFAALRVHGEWFRDDGQIREWAKHFNVSETREVAHA